MVEFRVRDRIKVTAQERRAAQRKALGDNPDSPGTALKRSIRQAYERAVRHFAREHQLSLRKSRDRYFLVDPTYNALIAGGEYGMTLYEAEDWLES
jgi:hypothetical protein